MSKSRPEFSTFIGVSILIGCRSRFFLSFGGQLSGDIRWIKLVDLIPWDEVEDDYAAHFCKGFGAYAKLFRMELGR